MSKAQVPNIDHVKSLTGLFATLNNSIEYMKEHQVPESYWQERLRWFVMHDMRQPGTLKEKKALLDVTLREITESYVLDKYNLKA